MIIICYSIDSFALLMIIILCSEWLMQIILRKNSEIILFYKNYLILVLLLILGNVHGISLLIDPLIEILILFNLKYWWILTLLLSNIVVVYGYRFRRQFLLINRWVHLWRCFAYSKWLLIIVSGRISNYKRALISLIIASQIIIYSYKVRWDIALHVLVVLVVNIRLLKNRGRRHLIKHILLSSIHILHEISIGRRWNKIRKRSSLVTS